MKTLKTAVVTTLLGFAALAGAQTVTPGLAVGVTAPASVVQGNDQTLATISLTNVSGTSLSLASLPLSMGYSGASGTTALTGCVLHGPGAVALNTGTREVGFAGSGDASVMFDQPLAVAPSSTTNLTFTCDISAITPNNSAIATAVVIPQVVATSSATGSAVVVSGISGAGAVTVVSPTAGSGDTTPGIPNTGAGGDAVMLIAVLMLAALAAGAGTFYLTRKAA